MELENNLDGELKVEAQEKGKMAVKVLDALVFSKFGGIEYSMMIRKTLRNRYNPTAGSFYFEFDRTASNVIGKSF